MPNWAPAKVPRKRLILLGKLRIALSERLPWAPLLAATVNGAQARELPEYW